MLLKQTKELHALQLTVLHQVHAFVYTAFRAESIACTLSCCAVIFFSGPLPEARRVVWSERSGGSRPDRRIHPWTHLSPVKLARVVF